MKNIFSKRKLLIFTIIFSLTVTLSLTTTGTYSFYTNGDTLANKIKLGEALGKIVEEFNGNEKMVWVRNTGTKPLLIRANARMICTNEDIILDATKIANALYNTTPTNEGDKNYWVDGEDGWYYYTKLLPANEMNNLDSNYYNDLADSTTTDILVHITIDTDNLPIDEKTLYDNSKLEVPVNFEYYFPLKTDEDIYTHEEAWNITSNSPVYEMLRILVDNKDTEEEIEG